MKIDRPRARRWQGVTAVAGLALCAPHAAQAQAAWSGPVTVATGANAIFSPGVAWTTAGSGVLGWMTGPNGHVALATAPPSTDRFASHGIYRPAHRVSSGDSGSFAAYGSSRLAFGGLTLSNRIAVVLARVGSHEGRRVKIGSRLQSGSIRLAANAAVTWRLWGSHRCVPVT
jgi:hypothetical protein